MPKKIAVLLSGCGYLDGAEIQEAVVTLLALDRAGADVTVLAPNISQRHVLNHQSGQPTGEVRNVLTETARISRGNVVDVAEAKAEAFDALVLPGGYGAAKNLCDFAIRGADCTIHPEVDRLLNEMFAARKPLGVICIAPAVLARALKGRDVQVKLTIGNDRDTAKALEALGAKHVDSPTDQIVTDEEHRVVSTPAYMLGPGPKEVAAGIEKLVAKVLEWA
ncbi:MAG: isoprenoid biosynthesis protein ElbB [Candidatus Zixiibacteriota bacterium]|nr:MAG: isoprenoid biosynthesis protein ElbB [candidate division Zixibacteria bacterium]